MENLLEVKNLSKRFEDSEFQLRDINFNIHRGEVVALIGRNGCGKSTSMKTVVGTTIKTAGEIWFKDQLVDSEMSKHRNQIGVVFDTMKFPEKLTALELSRYFNRIYDQWESDTYKSYLEYFNLPKDRQLKKFSRGMSMKLTFAVALSHRSELLILDEATAGIDVTSKEEILEHLETYVDRGNGILISSHMSEDIEKIADTLVFLRNGNVQLTVSKQDLYEKYFIGETTLDDLSSIPKSAVYAYHERKGSVKLVLTEPINVEGVDVSNIQTIDDVTKILMRGKLV
ncbi:ABC transporter ATP-binding protein [Staphylococcus massiliensis]|uniref:Multidrug ABC transporter ATP-binding protein n=1 Tax=Staphylococcus massiliensis S46 TaxID=1229783 RepID=K9B5F6_9STAP|nr:ABC transporter ATP-binding protein [Staphylococcus massiliensis]EKU50062.1 multidrug ABC transporter ATP-binding protein [Staphylococcus massiliensis S46]